MGSSLVALCADEESLRHPEMLGLAEERLAAQEWLRLFSQGEAARSFLRADREVEEVWVASSDDVDPINLAATLKKDRPDRRVGLLAEQRTGSLSSRANAGGIDAVFTRQAFLARYAEKKGVQVRGTVAQAETIPPARRSMQKQTRSANAFVLPVVSGSGGAGKSSVAVLAAVMAQTWGLKTLLLDFDFQFGDAARLLGEKDALTADAAAACLDKFDRLAPTRGLPAVIAAPEKLETAEALQSQANLLLDAACTRFDAVIVNTGATWQEQHAVALERCSKTLFLVDQRASSVHAAKHALELCGRCGIATTPFVFAVNHCSKTAPLTSIDVSCALGGVTACELHEGGSEVEELLSAGQAATLIRTKNPLCESIEKALGDMLPDCRKPVDAKAADSGARKLIGAYLPRRRKDTPCPC